MMLASRGLVLVFLEEFRNISASKTRGVPCLQFLVGHPCLFAPKRSLLPFVEKRGQHRRIGVFFCIAASGGIAHISLPLGEEDLGSDTNNFNICCFFPFIFQHLLRGEYSPSFIFSSCLLPALSVSFSS